MDHANIYYNLFFFLPQSFINRTHALQRKQHSLHPAHSLASLGDSHYLSNRTDVIFPGPELYEIKTLSPYTQHKTVQQGAWEQKSDHHSVVILLSIGQALSRHCPGLSTVSGFGLDLSASLETLEPLYPPFSERFSLFHFPSWLFLNRASSECSWNIPGIRNQGIHLPWGLLLALRYLGSQGLFQVTVFFTNTIVLKVQLSYFLFDSSHQQIPISF